MVSALLAEAVPMNSHFGSLQSRVIPETKVQKHPPGFSCVVFPERSSLVGICCFSSLLQEVEWKQ